MPYTLELAGAVLGDDDVDTSAITVRAKKLQKRASSVVTATTGGGTTGLIPAGVSFVSVTSDSADKQISLPAGTVGDRILVLVGATGCELIAAKAGAKVNEETVGGPNQ